MAKKKTSSLKTAKLVKASKKLSQKAAKPAPPVAKKAKKSVSSSKSSSKTAVRATEKKPAAPAPPRVAPAKPEPSLGRPLVTQEEKLYMLFHDDYQSRQVFEFLQVETVKQLEDFSPQQIVYMMSKPIRQTVDRIRQRLAEYKRSLKDDQHFAAMFQQQTTPLGER